MNQQQALSVRAALLKHGESFASIGRHLGLSRVYVRDVVLGARSNDAVWARITAVIGYDPRGQGAPPPAT